MSISSTSAGILTPSCTSTTLRDKLRDLSYPLSPLVQITTGYIHPAFPRMILNYYLLTSDELDSLMEFYHQKGNSEYMYEYPLPVGWEEGMDLERKRRRFGRFIGLRGCDSPVEESFGDLRSFEEKLKAAQELRASDELKQWTKLNPWEAESPRKKGWGGRYQ